jgi:hypothetical protein
MIMKEIIVIGAGGHAAEIDEYILYNQNSGISDYRVIGFLDDNPLSYKKYLFLYNAPEYYPKKVR